MSIFVASLRREWARLRASPWDFAMVSWVPALALGLMCWIFSAGQPFRLPVAVWNEDHSSISRQLVRMLEGIALEQPAVRKRWSPTPLEQKSAQITAPC